MKSINNNIIIGAGVSGIAAAIANRDKNPIIIEKNNDYGGLCNNFTIDGYSFDYGPHFSFTHNKIVRNLFDQTDFYSHHPYPVNYYNGLWIKHPVQNNLFPLSTEQKIRIIKGFVERKISDETLNNYDEWLKTQYGDYFTNEFPAKYTRKYWCKNPSDLTTSWVGERMYIPTLQEVLYGAIEKDTPNTYYAKEMRYPKNGGYREFLKHSVNGLNIRYNERVIKINPYDKLVYLLSGKRLKYKNIVNSMPLPELLKLVDNVPLNVINAGKRLLCSSICLVSIGFNKYIEIPSMWFYVYDENIPFSRVHSPNLKSSSNVPDGKSSLQFEVYYTHEKPLEYNEEELKEVIVDYLVKMELSSKDDIEFIDLRHVKYANVIFYKGMEEDRDIVLDYLSELNIKSIGRFGSWDYLWSDQSFLSGYNINMD